MSFQFKFGCLAVAVLLGGASAALAQSGGAGSGSGSNSSAGFVASSGSNGGSKANSNSNSSSVSSDGSRKVRSSVTPEYPALARRVNVTGKVKISVTISAEGRVLSTRVLGGSPLLTEAANTAVKQWKYEPAAKESVEIVEVEFSGK